MADGIGDVTGKNILITGATSGLGWHFAHLLSGAGARVVITGRRVERLEALCLEIENAGGRALPIALDVCDLDSIARTVEEAETELGPLDALINNAGISMEGRALEVSGENYDAIMDTNLKGPFFMATEVARRMIARRKEGADKVGKIVNIASVGAHTLLPGLSLYNMAKAGLTMMTRALAREWARQGVNVTAICPGYIETELNSTWFNSEPGKKQIATFTRRRLHHAEDLDGALLLLCSDRSDAMTGTVIDVDDGQSLVGIG